MTNKDNKDRQSGNYIPWFLRSDDTPSSGDFQLFFDRLSHRVKQLLDCDEISSSDLPHFGHQLESKSRQKFLYNKDSGLSLPSQISDYFKSSTIKKQWKAEIGRFILDKYKAGFQDTENEDDVNKKINDLAKENNAVIFEHQKKSYSSLFKERLGVLEVLLQIFPQKNKKVFSDFTGDIKSYFAESGIMFDLDEQDQIKPLDAPLLQKEVIDDLLPRLQSQHPEIAKELVKAYHDMLNGESFDSVFFDAFAALEKLAREITGDPKFEFTKSNLNKYYPGVHIAIHSIMDNLRGLRDNDVKDERKTPEPYEMRYLLFSICNTALLLLDCQR
ncbi:hypothetical protein BMS3Bbin08_02070 [bacterium BMS3Bbin08]|nr:hypothetical protein BMS3Bbin08_02070 [bacterium BMS3Bbin08]